MSDLRAPGNPGGTRGTSCPQQNQGPLTENDGDESLETALGGGAYTAFGPTPPGPTKAGKNPIR